jgi:hypothetical protein
VKYHFEQVDADGVVGQWWADFDTDREATDRLDGVPLLGDERVRVTRSGEDKPFASRARGAGVVAHAR